MDAQGQDGFVARVVDPNRGLVLGDPTGSATWALVLEPLNGRATRLVTRARGTYERFTVGLFLKLFWHPIHFAMQRRQLLNLKRRVEAAR